MNLEQYIPFEKKEFRPGQEHAINQILEAVENREKFIILNAPVGIGKAMCLDTIIPTDKGFKTIEDIQIGDYVFDDKGQRVKVINKTQKWFARPCYKVIFKNGIEIMVDEEHEWICNYNIDTKSSKTFIRRTTKELYLNYQKSQKYRHYIKKPDPMQYTKKTLPIPPYTLGIWLGDGTKTCSDITVNNKDLTIWDEIEKEGFLISKKYRSKGNAYTSAILDFYHLLRQNNLLNNKHIPKEYLFSDLNDRLALIQGLIDSDGYVDCFGQVEFSNNNFNIISNLKILLASCGIETNISSRIPKCNGKECQINYRLSFKATKDIPITRLPRYLKNIKDETRRWNTTYAIVDIQPIGLQDTVCIQVEGGVYCATEQYIPTHNSLIGYIVAKILNNNKEGVYLYTKTKQLQDQYLNDFNDVMLVKGRSNFHCACDPTFDCANGMCQTMSNFYCDSKPILKEVWEYNEAPLPQEPLESGGFYGDKEFNSWFLADMCPYWEQKIKGIMSPITMLNYNYAISDSRFVNHFPYRRLGVFDEGHNIEAIVMNEFEYSFSPSAVEKETQFKLTEHQIIEDWIDDIEEIIDIYKGLSKKTSSTLNEKKFKDRLLDFKSLHELLVDNPRNWVFTKEKQRGHLFYIFKPIKVNEYTHLLFDLTETCLIMSGTVLKPDIFARDLGIDDFTYIEIPSIIPIENRPIIKSYVGSMARSSIDVTMPNMIRRIQKIAEDHSDEKGVIHTFTYNIANRLKMGLKSNNRFIFHNQRDKERRFKEFQKNKTNKILVSPVAFEGIDFPYDMARWQCICKDPFPNIGDPQLKVRDMTDYGWLFRQRCLILSQMYGRTNRAADDYSVTYLLDSRIESLLGPATLVTDYFLEALEGYNYNTKLMLADDAYDRLTPDNKRKNHEVDRFQELAILDAIKDEGLNTMHLLRGAYKNMSNESYTLVIPAVQRLIKNGALYYG